MTDEPLTVSVLGAYDPPAGSEPYEFARQVGKTLAEQGYRIANGGYSGTMEASSRGAREVGGSSIGVTCAIWSTPPNGYLDRIVDTQDLHERISKLIELGTAGYVVLPGANGTLAELATVWQDKTLGKLQGRPLVCVGAYWTPVIELIARARPSSANTILQVAEVEQLREVFPKRSPA